MYVEDKSGGLNGPAWIGRVTFNRTGKSLTYRGRTFQSLKGAASKANYFDVDTGQHFWISGARKTARTGFRLVALRSFTSMMTSPKNIGATFAAARLRLSVRRADGFTLLRALGAAEDVFLFDRTCSALRAGRVRRCARFDARLCAFGAIRLLRFGHGNSPFGENDSVRARVPISAGRSFLRMAGPAWAANDLAGTRAGVFAAAQHLCAVDEDVAHAG